MKQTKPLISALILLSALLLSCGNDAAEQPANSVSADTLPGEVSGLEAENTYPALELPVTDYDGATVTIMSSLVKGTATDTRFAEFFYDEALAGDVVNDAVLTRNLLVEELLNVDIVSNDIAGDQILDKMRQQIMAGDSEIDVYTPPMGDLLGLIVNGNLVNLHDMPVMNIENPWWDQAINRDLSMADKVFMQGGDILFSSKEHHTFLCVNAKILADHGLEVPYQTVLDGKWTIDVMYDLCRNLTADLNGDGVLNHLDRFGCTNSYDSAYWLFVDAGGRIAELDDDGVPVLCEDNDQNLAVLEKMALIYTDPTIYYDVSKMPDRWNTNREMFMNDQVAIQPASIYNLQSRREMVSDFGILPCPKYDENQEEYINCPVTFRMQMITVPVTNIQMEVTGAVLEALAYYSKDTTLEAYYEVNLQGKVSRDDESRQMLDLIFSTVSYDLIDAYRWGNMFKVVYNGIANPSTFMSAYAADEKAARTAMEDTFSYFQEMEP